jgi:hypothetical protein
LVLGIDPHPLREWLMPAILAHFAGRDSHEKSGHPPSPTTARHGDTMIAPFSASLRAANMVIAGL